MHVIQKTKKNKKNKQTQTVWFKIIIQILILYNLSDRVKLTSLCVIYSHMFHVPFMIKDDSLEI